MTHAHHWLLAPDTFVDIPATCRDCGATKTFASAEGSAFGYTSAPYGPGALTGRKDTTGYGRRSRGWVN